MKTLPYLLIVALAVALPGCGLLEALLVPPAAGTDSALVQGARQAQSLAPGVTWTEMALAASIAAQNLYLGWKTYRKRR